MNYGKPIDYVRGERVERTTEEKYVLVANIEGRGAY